MTQLTQSAVDAFATPKTVSPAAGVQFIQQDEKGRPVLCAYTEADGKESWAYTEEEVEIIDDKKEDILEGDKLLTQIAAYLNSQGLTADDLLAQIQTRIKTQK
jgi:hypothetical protein